jgi:hypothetical protein
MAALAISPLRVNNCQTLIAPTRMCRLLSLSLPETHPGAAAVLGDKFDAGREPKVTGEEALKVHRLIDALIDAGAECLAIARIPATLACLQVSGMRLMP